MKKVLLTLIILFGLTASVNAQKINPANQIQWPAGCTTGLLYSPFNNTCPPTSNSAITALTGDGTATGPGSVPFTLSTVNSGPGTCGDANDICQVTTNGKGLVTSQTTVPVSATNSFQMNLVPPTTGQYVPLCSGTQSGSGSDSSQIFTYVPCGGAVSASGGPIGAPHSASVTWSNYSLPAYVNPANVTAVYATIMMRAQTSGIGSWTFVCSAQNVGTTSVTTTKQFNTLLSGVTGSNIGSVSCTVSAAHSGGNAGTFTYVGATVELFAFYTGTPPPTPNFINIQPPLNWDPSTKVLSLDVPPNTGTDSGTTNNYQVTLGSTPLFIPGLTLTFLPGNTNTTTTPTLIVNGVLSGTIENSKGGAIAAGDISNSAVATVILGPDNNWWLQDPQVSGTSLANALTMNNSGSGAASGTTFDGSAARTLSYNTIGAAPSASPVFTGTVDASGATQMKLPVASGYASAANGELGYDTTNKNWHIWANAADNVVALFPAGSPPSNNDCAQWSVSGGVITLGFAAGSCGTGSGGDTITSPNSTLNVGGTSTNTTLDVAPVATVVDTSSTVTVSTSKPAEYHFNENSTAAQAVTYDLPTAAAGKQFCFSNQNNGSNPNTGTLELLTSASGQFIIFTDGTLSATGGYVISSGLAGDAACLAGIDSTHWAFYPSAGTWTKH